MGKVQAWPDICAGHAQLIAKVFADKWRSAHVWGLSYEPQLDMAMGKSCVNNKDMPGNFFLPTRQRLCDSSGTETECCGSSLL